MRLRWYTVVVDAIDVRAQAHWWRDAIEGEILFETDEEALVIPGAMPPEYLTGEPIPAERWQQVPPGLLFVPVPEHKQGKNRLHIDLAPHVEDDREAQIRRLLTAGATKVDVGQDEDEVTWTVLADPEGNEFCVLSSRTV